MPICGTKIARYATAFALAALLTTQSAATMRDEKPDDGATACHTLPKHVDKQSIKAIAECQAFEKGIPASLVLAVIEVESNFQARAAGADGEVGLMQVMPATAAMLGFKGTLAQLRDPLVNIELGTRYLSGAYRLAGGDLCTTVMKYRAGHGETRFSYRSVAYCHRVRSIFKRDGVQVTGTVPNPTFGKQVAGRSTGGSGGSTCLRRNLMPGPGYMACVQYGSASQATRNRKLRKQLFN